MHTFIEKLLSFQNSLHDKCVKKEQLMYLATRYSNLLSVLTVSVTNSKLFNIRRFILDSIGMHAVSPCWLNNSGQYAEQLISPFQRKSMCMNGP